MNSTMNMEARRYSNGSRSRFSFNFGPQAFSNLLPSPVDVIFMVVEDVLEAGTCSDHVARCGVQHTLGLTSGARCVQHKQRLLRLHPHHLRGATKGAG